MGCAKGAGSMTKKKSTPEAHIEFQGRLNASAGAGARGSIIERFATTEAVIDAMICSYYFPGAKPPREFLEDVVFDASFSFELRRRVFEKILRREGLFDDSRMQDIRRLSKLRNQAAHARGKDVDERAALEFFHVAGRVERFYQRVVVALRLHLHPDPLPTRNALLAALEED